MTPDKGLPIVNGNTAVLAIKGALFLIGLLIVAVTIIIVFEREIPAIFITAITLLIGFLVGSRVVTPDAAHKAESAPFVPPQPVKDASNG